METTVLVLFRDADGFTAALADALRPNPSSNLASSKSSSINLSLEKYGITDANLSADLIEFLDPRGSTLVSIFILPNYNPPVAACAMNELLNILSSEKYAPRPTIVLPHYMKTLKVAREDLHELLPDKEITIYSAEIAGSNDLTQAMIVGTASAPSSLRINCEPLACLLTMVRVLQFPTVLLIASGGRNRSELESPHSMGQFLENHLGLCFSKEATMHIPSEKPKTIREPWRELYG